MTFNRIKIMSKFNSRLFILLTTLGAGLWAAAQESGDSIAADTTAVELKGVEVEAMMQSTSARMSTYLPTNQQKKSAFNGTDLLLRMSIPELKVKPMSTSVSTVSGESVSLFVDYLPASDAEIEGMRPADVKRVEVLQFPTDPRFQGARHVVNFIMQKYEYGGYTKLQLTQFVPLQYSYFQPYSKFAYKKMTFDVTASVFDRRSHHFSDYRRQTYRLTSPDGTGLTQVRDLDPLYSHNIYDKIPVSVRAIYGGEKMTITNTLAFMYSNSPRSLQAGAVSYGDGDSSRDYSYETSSPESHRRVSWEGNYYFVLPHDFSLSATPSLGYENIHARSGYVSTVAPDDPIVNDTRESLYNGYLILGLYKRFKGGHNLNLNASGFYSGDRLDYSGSNPYRNRFRKYTGIGGVTYSYGNEKWFAMANAGIVGQKHKVNGEVTDKVRPQGGFNVSFSPNRKNSIRASFQFNTTTPGLAERSPNVVQSNEFLYVTGDPDVTDFSQMVANLTYTWMPNNRLQMSAFGNYMLEHDRLTCIYTPYDGGAAVLRTYVNDGNFSNGSAGVSVSYAIIPGKLTGQLSATQNFYRSTGYYSLSRNPFSYSAYINYYVGRFSVYGMYESESRSLTTYGEYYKAHDSYQVGASCRLGGWNIMLAALNFFKYNYKSSVSVLDTPLFTSISGSCQPWAKFSVALRVSYTFSYGKKVQQGNELQTIGEGTSGRLK